MLSNTELAQKIKIDNLITDPVFEDSEYNYYDKLNNLSRKIICCDLFRELWNINNYKIKTSGNTYILSDKFADNKCTLDFSVSDHNEDELNCIFYLRGSNMFNIFFQFHNWKKLINFLINEKDYYLKICDEFSKLKNSDKYTFYDFKSDLKDFRLTQRLTHNELLKYNYYFIPKKDTQYSGKFD